MNVLCIGRHPYLSDFLADYFRDADLHTTAAVGLIEAERAVSEAPFDVVVCDYDLIPSPGTEGRHSHPLFRAGPVVAVSLTRNADEVPTLDEAALALYLYLPSVPACDARQMVRGARSTLPYALPTFDRSREQACPPA